MKGFLDKKQPKAFLFGKWKARYCVLKRDKFKYYLNKETEEHLGVIDFNKVEASVYLIPDDVRTFKITINGCGKEFFFRASNSVDAKTWVKHLEDGIASSRGKHLSLTINHSKFWKNEYIDMHEFQNHADNCDLMLFRSRSYGTKIQRTFTGSNYDHVGMIVLGETEENLNTIFLLEAVADEGVRLVEFIPNIEAYFEVYDMITYRPLQELERSEDLLEQLDEYLEEVLGKKYAINLGKFWRKSINLKGSDGKHMEDVNRTFQGAELVAKMYKVLGILGPDEHSGKYIPAHFTEKRKIKLQKGSFGPEGVILEPDSH